MEEVVAPQTFVPDALNSLMPILIAPPVCTQNKHAKDF
jgi:fructose-specific phosphotransferase system IIC component